MTKASKKDAINPSSLKYWREKANYHTQVALAEKLGCKVDQVNRWENGRTKKPNSRLLQELLKSLKVSWEDLTQPPPKEASAARNVSGIQLNRRVDASTRTALEVVSMIYGVRWRDILELAPLMFLILAQQSLKAREKALNDARERLDEAVSLANRSLFYIPGGFREFHSEEELLSEEEDSIKRRKVFQPYYDFDGIEYSPFASHLQDLFEELFDWEMDLHPNDDWAPSYEIPVKILQEITGIPDDGETNKAILKCIQGGSLDLHEIRSAKEKFESKEYREWLESKYREVKSEADAFHKQWIEEIFGKDEKSKQKDQNKVESSEGAQ